ncbi:hypothetical protein [Microbulbifer sp.]|uniref:hypothetical protein n=1 Tax=Microbulbifer sp. TaxID=1908541 RepID=UPI003F2F22C4
MLDDALPEADAAAVEAQLLARGAFTSVQWLLDCGALTFAGYEDWRRGGLPTLEAAVACDRDQLLARLRGAEAAARALKLVAEPQPFYSWGDESGRELRPSRDAELARLLGGRWLRPQDAPQLDLFMDGGAAGSENELLQALAERQWRIAEDSYQQLCQLAPDNPHLGGYETLLLYGRHMGANAAVEDYEEELDALETEIAPLARDLLRDRARDYLALAWQRLATAGVAGEFDPQQPKRHPSFAWARAGDWPRVIESLRAVDGFETRPLLLARLATALWQTRRREPALLVWCHLFEVAPEFAEESAEDDRGPLAELWRDFGELPEELSAEHFSPWLLLREPGLAHHFEGTEFPTPRGRATAAVCRLLALRARGEPETAARQALQAEAPALLKIYLGDA